MTSQAAVNRQQETKTAPGSPGSSVQNSLMLFVASFLALYFELVIIRYLSSEIRIFAYLKNLSLIASFFGIGLGMIGRPSAALKRLFPLIAAVLFLLIAFASPLKLTHIVFPNGGYVTPGDFSPLVQGRWFGLWLLLSILEYLVVVPGILYVVMVFFSRCSADSLAKTSG